VRLVNSILAPPFRLSVMFDDDHAVANARFALVGILSGNLGLEELAEEAIEIAPFPGCRSSAVRPWAGGAQLHPPSAAAVTSNTAPSLRAFHVIRYLPAI
jgi:hypothetical protein